MIKLPSISVIIPVYNVERYISACLLSVFNQEYDGDIELIIVDDCGSDQSMAIVNHLIKEYKGPVDIKIVAHEENKGLSVARNTGLQASTKDYVLFVDSDDALLENALSTLGGNAAGCELVVGRYLKSNDKFGYFSRTTQSYIGAECFRAFLDEEYPVTSWNKLYLRTFLAENRFRFQEGMLYEDLIWSFQIGSKARSIRIINTPTYMYRIREDSISHGVKGEREVVDKTRCLSSIVQYCEKIGCLHDHKVQRFLLGLKDCFLWTMRFPSENRYTLWKAFNDAFSPDRRFISGCDKTSLKRKIKFSVSWLPSPVGYLIWLGIKASNGN